MEEIKSILEKNKDKFLNELLDLLKIPSVSANPAHKGDMIRAAEFLLAQFGNLKVARTEMYETPGHPIVYAETEQKPGRPTVLVYGHYDVQPPDPLELWNSPPFEPVIKDGKIYARGSCDDKGQVFMHVKALEIMNELGELPCNIKFVIEGEEEVGSDNLETFIREYNEMLACDVIMISDTSMIANDVPSLTTGLRGLSYVEVEVTGPNRDLHSGTYGGGVDNPINVLTEMIAALKDENRSISIPGFYDDVLIITEEERTKMAERPFDHAAYCSDLEINTTRGEAGYSLIEQVSIRPTLDVNGIWGGYTGEGAKTVLPSKAFAKISMRLVPNQDPDKITKLFTDYFLSLAPESVKVKVIAHHGGRPAVTPIDSIGFKAASAAMKDAFGKAPIPTREGGSIPIVAMFKDVLGANTVLMGFGLDSDAIHSPNEHYGVFNYFKGIETIPLFHKYFAEMSK
ncbi:MAG TPA: dipeptidase [Bacteroidetes bacterium]|nr:dipeptidase [Bacteroidota bacterium]